MNYPNRVLPPPWCFVYALPAAVKTLWQSDRASNTETLYGRNPRDYPAELRGCLLAGVSSLVAGTTEGVSTFGETARGFGWDGALPLVLGVYDGASARTDAGVRLLDACDCESAGCF